MLLALWSDFWVASGWTQAASGGGGGPKPPKRERWIPPDGRSREQDYQRFAEQLLALESQPNSVAKQTRLMAGFIDLGNPGILPAPTIHDDMGNLREIALALLADGFED